MYSNTRFVLLFHWLSGTVITAAIAGKHLTEPLHGIIEKCAPPRGPRHRARHRALRVAIKSASAASSPRAASVARPPPGVRVASTGDQTPGVVSNHSTSDAATSSGEWVVRDQALVAQSVYKS